MKKRVPKKATKGHLTVRKVSVKKISMNAGITGGGYQCC